MNETLIKYSELKDNFTKVEIKLYLPHSIKRVMIDTILETCVSENENGLKVVDYGLLELVKQYKIVNEYTNIDFSEEEVLVVFDEMNENGTLKKILQEIPQDELEFFDSILHKEIQQIYQVDNSLQNVVAKSLNKLIDKLPDEKGMQKLLKLLPREINKINPDSMKFVAEAIGFNNGVKQNHGEK